MLKQSILFSALFVTSHATLADTLLSIYQDALANDPQFAVARAQFVSVEEKLPQSLAALLPAVSLSANTTWNENQSNTASSDGSYNSNGYSINLTQPLFRRQNNIALDQAETAVVQARAQLELARQDLIVRVGQAYFDVLLAQDNLQTIQAQQAAAAEQYASARRKFDIGTSTITDVRDTQARHTLINAQLIAAQNDLDAKRQALRVLTNKAPGTLSALRPGVTFSMPAPGNIDEWAAAAETNSLWVVAGQAALDIARLEIDKARAAHFPSIDLTASHGNSKSGTVSTIGTDITSNTIGLQLSLPIYSGGGTVARQREVRALLDKAQGELEGARRNTALSARQSFLGVTSGLAQSKALEEALDSAQTALEANKRGLEVGVRVDIDVLNAQQQYSVTRRDLAKSRYDTIMALFRLKSAAGSLSEKDVDEVNALLTSELR